MYKEKTHNIYDLKDYNKTLGFHYKDYKNSCYKIKNKHYNIDILTRLILTKSNNDKRKGINLIGRGENISNLKYLAKIICKIFGLKKSNYIKSSYVYDKDKDIRREKKCIIVFLSNNIEDLRELTKIYIMENMENREPNFEIENLKNLYHRKSGEFYGYPKDKIDYFIKYINNSNIKKICNPYCNFSNEYNKNIVDHYINYNIKPDKSDDILENAKNKHEIIKDYDKDLYNYIEENILK